MSGTPKSKDQYGPPLGTYKINTQHDSLQEKNKASSSISLRPQIPSSNITLANVVKTPTPSIATSTKKYTPLQYTNILVGPKDFMTKPSQLVSPSINPEPSRPPTFMDEYLIKPDILPIITLEKEWIKENPTKTAEDLFPSTFHYHPQNVLKNRTFYEFILVDTDSAEISHTSDKEGTIIYSKIKILRIMTPQEWNQPLHSTKTFSRQFTPQYYSYFDYMEAWNNVLYLIPEKHSWFIWFKKGISLKFPKWFIKWFRDFGPLPSLFPQKVAEVYNYFREHSSFVPGYRLISFVASQSITWILAWDYSITNLYEEVDIKLLSRRLRIKWWKKFNNDVVSITKVQDWLKYHSEKKPEASSSLNKESLFLSNKQKIMAALASASSKEEFEKNFRKGCIISWLCKN